MSELPQLQRLPKVGEQVRCPPDRGNSAYTGKVWRVGENVYTNIHGVDYVWVTVTKGKYQREIWPSHRLKFKLGPGGAPTPTAVPACRLHIDHELDPKYHE